MPSPRTIYHGAGSLSPQIGYDLNEAAVYDPAGTFSNACHIAFVEVDPETGGVRIERYLVVEDAGRLINPMIVDGQVQGGVAQGIGNALFEEIVYAEDGNILTSSFADFLPPTVAEIPDIEIHHLVHADRRLGHRGQGRRRGRGDRRAGRGGQRDLRRARPARHRDLPDAGHPGPAARADPRATGGTAA